MTAIRLLLAAVVTLVPIAASAQQASPPPPTAAADPYRVNAGDELDVNVWGEERLQRTVRVLPDGTFSFPLVGQVRALNALPSEIAAAITRGLGPQYRGEVPQVTVSVKSPSGMQFSVIGKVRNPGAFTPERYVNALEALSMAGGPTEFAQISDIVIIRKVGNGLQAVRVRLTDALKGNVSGISSAAIPQIEAGDTLVVP